MFDVQVRTRLVAIASRLASDHDGEVLNAARLLLRALKKGGMTTADLFAPPPGIVAPITRAAGWSPWGDVRTSGVCSDLDAPPRHVAMVDELLAPRWAMIRSHRTERLLRTLRLAPTLADDERVWLDKLYGKMVRLRSKSVADAQANIAEDFTV